MTGPDPDPDSLAVVSRRVIEGDCARFLYREPTDRAIDSGWQVFAGGEGDDYRDDPDNFELLPLRDLIEADPRLGPVLDSPAGSAFERGDCEAEFRPVEGFGPPPPA